METVIPGPKKCDDCIFKDYYNGILTCRFQPNYKRELMPASALSGRKPDFCKIQKIIVLEED